MATNSTKKSALVALVHELVESDPYERDGFLWAARPQGFLAEKLGVAAKTISRWSGEPPFQRKVVLTPQNDKVTLLRVGDPAPPDPHAVALTLRGVWRNKTGMEPITTEKAQADWDHMKRCLWGFAKDVMALPEVKAFADDPGEFAKAAFKFALNDWQTTASAIKIAALTHKAINPDFKIRFWDYPSVPLMLFFYKAVIHAYVTFLQMNGKVPAAKMNSSAALLAATDLGPGMPSNLSADEEAAIGDAIMAKVDPKKKPWKPVKFKKPQSNNMVDAIMSLK